MADSYWWPLEFTPSVRPPGDGASRWRRKREAFIAEELIASRSRTG